jgi:hypothetical protein
MKEVAQAVAWMIYSMANEKRGVAFASGKPPRHWVFALSRGDPSDPLTDAIAPFGT